MLVEFTGCTGAGKSTLVRRVRETLFELGIETVSSTELVAQRFGLKAVGSPTVENILFDFLVFPQVILSLKRNFKFFVFALQILSRKPASIIGALNYFRSVMRKIGVHELIRRKEYHEQIIIVDEGTIHAAHNLFVYSNCTIIDCDARKFLYLIPLPDLVICVSAPVEIILERTLNRKDPPVKNTSKHSMKIYIERALKVFRIISLDKLVREKLFSAEFMCDSTVAVNTNVRKIVDFVIEAQNPQKSRQGKS